MAHIHTYACLKLDGEGKVAEPLTINCGHPAREAQMLADVINAGVEFERSPVVKAIRQRMNKAGLT
jgi:hypothetical protein